MFFKKKPASSAADSYVQQAQEALKQGQPQQALGALSHGFVADVMHQPLYGLAAQTLERMGGQEEAQLFLIAQKNLTNPKAFFDLGYHFVEVGHDTLAVPFLERAVKLEPQSLEYANELSLAYSSTFRPGQGHDVLEKHQPIKDFWAISCPTLLPKSLDRLA